MDMTPALTDTAMEPDLEEGGLYVVRKGKLELVPRNDEEGMRKVRITEEAYQRAMDIGQRMRRELGGYKPDVSLVVSAILLGGIDEAKAKRMVRTFVLRMFSDASIEPDSGSALMDPAGAVSIEEEPN